MKEWRGWKGKREKQAFCWLWMLAVAVWLGFSVCIVRSPASPVLSLCAGGGRFAELADRTFSRLYCLPGLNTVPEHLRPGEGNKGTRVGAPRREQLPCPPAGFVVPLWEVGFP